ncbi:MAG TPA: M20/M25/M40 family metallo-hydrolase [Bryobacteraceae bacterium]|nr:M20/M25/M40 family metallo-hydrolase [Bryobacteraceae bacterium]
MRRIFAFLLIVATCGVAADDNRPLGDRTRQYLLDLLRLDTSNPPGNETRVADYLKQVADAHGISCDLVGNDPHRQNFIARLKGAGKGRPLLLIAHTDVFPAERSQWSVDPFAGENRNGYIYGRGTQDDKSLLAAELAVLVEIKRRNIKLGRDLILLAEADEEGGNNGIERMLQRDYFQRIDAEFALNEGGYVLETRDGPKIFNVQTTEKIPSGIILTAKSANGPARMDNPVVRLMDAVQKLARADQPVRLNQTTRRYFRELSKVPDYAWLDSIRRRLDDPNGAMWAANQIRAHDPALEAMLRTTVTPTLLRAGFAIDQIPSTAEAELDVRRLPSETRDELLARFRGIINDPLVEISFAAGQQMPATEPSAITTPLYRAMERAIGRMYPRDLVIPFMGRRGTDSSFLRARGMAVYGVPIFVRESPEGRAHGNDERISPRNLEDGAELLWQIVLETAGAS